MSEVHITEHAYDRAKDRLSLRKQSIDRLAVKAFDKGICPSDTSGSLKKWVASVYAKYNKANNIRIFGDNVFFFCDNVLVTLYRLPNELKNHVKRIRNSKSNKNDQNESN